MMYSKTMKNQDFFSVLERISSFALLNLLWVAVSLLVVTLPTATAGLFAVFGDWVEGRNSEGFARFFTGMRETWGRATQIALLDVLGVGLVGANLILLPEMNLPTVIFGPFVAITLFVGVVAMATNLYLWPLLVRYKLSVRVLLQTALGLVFQHIGWTLLLLSMTAFVLLSGLLLLPVGLIVLTLASTCVWLISWGAWRIIEPYDAVLLDLQGEFDA